MNLDLTKFTFDWLHASATNMVRYRQSLNSCIHGENDQNTCSSCFPPTKYNCLLCAMPICNKCLLLEDNEKASGWAAGKQVGSCQACNKKIAVEANPPCGKTKQGMVCNVKFPYCWGLTYCFFPKLIVKCIYMFLMFLNFVYCKSLCY